VEPTEKGACIWIDGWVDRFIDVTGWAVDLIKEMEPPRCPTPIISLHTLKWWCVLWNVAYSHGWWKARWNQ
jgi:hypothetical protein